MEVVEPRIPMCQCKWCPGAETHRLLLIGDQHFVIEKVAGKHTDYEDDEEEPDRLGLGAVAGAHAAAARMRRATAKSAEASPEPEPEPDTEPEAEPAHGAAAASLRRLRLHVKVGTKLHPNPKLDETEETLEPFDVATKRVLLRPRSTFRRKVLSGLIQDVYWVDMARRSLSLTKFVKQLLSGVLMSLLVALPIALISSQTNCLNTLSLHEIMDGREYDTSDSFPKSQKENFLKWCGEFPIDMDNPQIPSACVSSQAIAPAPALAPAPAPAPAPVSCGSVRGRSCRRRERERELRRL